MKISIVLVITLIVTLISYEGFRNISWREQFLFNPYAISYGKKTGGVFSYFWFHSDWPHLILNMFSFLMIGGELEKRWIEDFGELDGNIHFASLYLFGGVAPTVIPYLVS